MPDMIFREPGTVIARADPPTPMEMIANIASIARDPSIPVDRIAALIGLQERMEAREAEKQFNAAFAAAMLEMPTVVKRGVKDMGGKGSIPYATYEDVDAAIRPLETRHGFARSFLTRPADKPGCVMVLRLTHKAGHSITSERYCRPDPGPGRNDTQAEGSGESYGRRYLTLAIWNIVTVGADDDANSADPISDEQALGLREKLDFLAPTPKWYEQWWAWIGPEQEHRVESIQKKDFDRINADLTRRVKAQEAKRA